jgi:hypothetical protein
LGVAIAPRCIPINDLQRAQMAASTIHRVRRAADPAGTPARPAIGDRESESLHSERVSKPTVAAIACDTKRTRNTQREKEEQP